VQITSILDIVDGRLLNHPSISFIYSIKTNPKKVKEGDLFIVKDDEDIPKAIENGAFAIIVDKEVSISDNEIAWIFVESMNDAIVKLVRYLLSNKRLNAFYCNNVSYDLFKIF
jgi:ferrochelatase